MPGSDLMILFFVVRGGFHNVVHYIILHDLLLDIIGFFIFTLSTNINSLRYL